MPTRNTDNFNVIGEADFTFFCVSNRLRLKVLRWDLLTHLLWWCVLWWCVVVLLSLHMLLLCLVLVLHMHLLIWNTKLSNRSTLWWHTNMARWIVILKAASHFLFFLFSKQRIGVLLVKQISSKIIKTIFRKTFIFQEIFYLCVFKSHFNALVHKLLF